MFNPAFITRGDLCENDCESRRLAQTLSASINGIDLGVYRHAITPPRFIGIEGVGFVDNFVVRNVP